MRAVYRGPAPPRVSALGRTSTARPQTFNYHAVGGRLLSAIGEYCSYCEVPLTSNAAVEHIVSKSTSTNLETNWDNFLLACVNCNSTKGASKVETIADLKTFIWACTPADVVVDASTTYFSPTGAFVYSLDAQGYAIVTAAEGPKKTAALATLKLVGLDKAPGADPAVRDRRITNRTAAWEIARTLATAYGTLIDDAGTPTSEYAGLVEKQIIETAKVVGFWSVWMTLFTPKLVAKGGMSEATRNIVLVRLFYLTFPGSYYANMPGAPDDDYTGLPLS